MNIVLMNYVGSAVYLHIKTDSSLLPQEENMQYVTVVLHVCKQNKYGMSQCHPVIMRVYWSIFSQMKFNGELQALSFQLFIELKSVWISAQFSSLPSGPLLSGCVFAQNLEVKKRLLSQMFTNIIIFEINTVNICELHSQYMWLWDTG